MSCTRSSLTSNHATARVGRSIKQISEDLINWNRLPPFGGPRKELIQECSLIAITSVLECKEWRDLGVIKQLRKALRSQLESKHVDQDYIELFLASGVDPDSVFADKTTKNRAVHWCAQQRLWECLESLHNCRADFEVKNLSEVSALDFLREAARTNYENDEVDASLNRLLEGLQQPGPSLASLAQKKAAYAVQNLIRRGLSALDYTEFSERVDGRTAMEWAFHHGLTGLADEIKFREGRAKKVLLQELQRRQKFVEDYLKLGAAIQIEEIHLEENPAVWLPKCLLADVRQQAASTNTSPCSVQYTQHQHTAIPAGNAIRQPFIEHVAYNYSFFDPSAFWLLWFPDYEHCWIRFVASLREFITSNKIKFDRVVSDMLVEYAKQNPGVISIMGILCCLAPLIDSPFQEEFGLKGCVASTVDRIGKDLDHLAKDKYGRTSLMLLDTLYRNYAGHGVDEIPLLMEKVVDCAAESPSIHHLQGLLRAQEPCHGCTIAHTLVMTHTWYTDRRDRVLQRLVDKDPMLLLIQDKKGRTPEQLARDMWWDERVELLEELRKQKAAADSQFKDKLGVFEASRQQGISLNRAHPWNFLPLHVPSFSNAVTTGIPACSNQQQGPPSNWDMFEKFVCNELPGLLHQEGESLVVFIPPFTPPLKSGNKSATLPSDTSATSSTKVPPAKQNTSIKDGWKKGREAEDTFLEGIKKASESSTLLDELKAKKLRLAIFHGLRYMAAADGGRAGADPSKTGSKPQEGEIDVILLCYSTLWDSDKGRCMMCLVEIKAEGSNGSVKNVLKNHHYKALAQLARSFEVLKDQTSVKTLEWIRIAVGLPNCLDNTILNVKESIIEEAKRAYTKKLPPTPTPGKPSIAEKLVYSVLPTMEQHQLAIFRNAEIDAMDGWIKKWIQSQKSPLVSIKDFQAILSWCLVKCFGVTVTLASKAMDNDSLHLLRDNPAPGQTAPNTAQQQDRIALLTNVQKAILRSPSEGVLLIVGTVGSGKSLLAQQKLLQMLKQRDSDGRQLISPKRQAAFLSCAKNRAFNWQVKQVFKEHSDLIHVFEWEYSYEDQGLSKCVEYIKNSNDIAYLVVDQMEDGNLRDTEYIKTLLIENYRMGSTSNIGNRSFQFKMIWVLVKEEKFHGTQFARGLSQSLDQENIRIQLGTRIRNAGPICRALNVRANMLIDPTDPVNTKLSSARAVPNSLGYPGLKPMLAAYSEKPDSMKPLRNVLSRVVSYLDQRLNLSQEEMMILVGEEFVEDRKAIILEQLDAALVEQSSESNKQNEVVSLAPFVVEIPATLMRADYGFINEENCKKAFTYIQDAKKGASPQKLSRDEIYGNPLLAIADGILRRDSSMAFSGPHQNARCFSDNFAKELTSTVETFNDASRQPGCNKEAPRSTGGQKTPLQTFLERYPFLSVLHWEEVDGFEANAVIVVVDKPQVSFESIHMALSRAKIMAVIVHEERTNIEELNYAFGPGTFVDEW